MRRRANGSNTNSPQPAISLPGAQLEWAQHFGNLETHGGNEERHGWREKVHQQRKLRQ